MVKKKIKRNTEGLHQYTQNRKQEAEDRANKAIDELKRKNKTINFKLVAETSGVSKATLYNNEKIRVRIESLRALKKSPEAMRDIEKKREDKEMELRRQIDKLKTEKNMLVMQLVEMDKLIEENQKLKSLLASRKRE